MKNFTVFGILLMLISAVQTDAQYTCVKLNTTGVHGEVWIAMNPKNLNNIVAGVNGYSTPQSNMEYFYSFNGGYNWSGSHIYNTSGQPGSDPVVVVDTNGYFYYLCVANWFIPPPNADKLLCNKSTNGGANWNNGTSFGLPAPKMNDMPMACVDLSHSPYTNNLYVTWTLIDSMNSTNPHDSSYVYFCRSTNQGQSFSTPKRISKIAGSANWTNSTPEGPVPCTGTNGEIYVTYPHNQKILFTRSLDGGNTWLNSEIQAANQPGGWLWHHSPVIACDLSNSPYRGHVYIVFSYPANGTYNRDIFLVKSTNIGDTWSAPVKVNNDATTLTQEMPWISVDPVTGYIWIVFYDGRHHPTGSIYDVYVARSTNGGSTFQNTRVSDANSKTLTSYWLGDYISITAINNKVRPLWTTSVGYGSASIWTAIMDTFTIGIQNISTEIPSSLSLSQNYPNPFNPETKIRFSIPSREGWQTKSDGVGFATLKVYDALGREIETLVNEELQPGTYEVTFNGSGRNSGVYFYRLEAERYSETRKMLLIK